jgi:ribosomal protein S18 acetylase RimI-like enzyme
VLIVPDKPPAHVCGLRQAVPVTASTTALRPLTQADAQALLSLIEACDVADIGEVDYSLEDVQDDLTRETWRGWVIDDGDGGFRALCWLEREPGRPRIDGDVRVHPDADAELGHELLAFIRAQARLLEPSLPLHVYTAVDAATSRRTFDAAGGRVIRHFWRMTMSWDEAPEIPPPPGPGVTIEQPDDDEAQLRTLHQVIDTAFLDHFGSTATDFDEWLARQRGGTGPDIGLWWLVRVGGAPAAVLIGRAWPEQGWVQGLGTLREFRGRGLARLLLLTAFAEFHRRGYRRAGLSVDATNPTGAVALYESVGMSVAYEAVLYEFAVS